MQLPKRLLCVILSACASSCTPSTPPAAPSADQQTTPTDGEPGEDGEVADGEPANAPPDSTAEYDEMAASVELSDDEDAALLAAFRARDEAVGAWLAEKRGRLADLEQQMKTAAGNRNLSRFRKLTGEAKPLRDELRALIDTHRDAIRTTLTPEHQIHWAGHELAERLLKLMETLELKPEQTAMIRVEAVSAAQAAANETNPAAAGYLQLEKAVEVRVLTPEQRQSFAEIKRQNPLRSLY